MTSCSNTLEFRQGYGGWILYWKLIRQLYGQIPQLWNLVGTMQEGKKVTHLLVIMLVMSMIIKTPWWAFIKPLGYFFHTQTKYEGTHKEIGNRVKDINYTKKGVVYFLRIIPVWFIYGKSMNKKDKERLFKDKEVI